MKRMSIWAWRFRSLAVALRWPLLAYRFAAGFKDEMYHLNELRKYTRYTNWYIRFLLTVARWIILLTAQLLLFLMVSYVVMVLFLMWRF